METLTSRHNPRIKAFARLKKRQERDETETFLIEGFRELRLAVENNVKITTVLFCEVLFLGENEHDLIETARKNGAEILSCSDSLFAKLSYRDRPDGLLAVAKMQHTTLADLPLKKEAPPFLLIAEAIEKPGNLGSILRSCDGAGVDGVIVCDRCTDIFNPNVVRASVGTLFAKLVVEATSDETIAFLRAQNISILAATPSASLEFTKTSLTGPVALAVGTEQLGLSEKWLREADISVQIPMMGVADSLNVSAATTLLLYEVLRQRSS